MNLDLLLAGSYINWPVVGESWAKRTVPSRLLLFAARRYLDAAQGSQTGETPLDLTPLEEAKIAPEIAAALSSPPEPEGEPSREWGRFLDAAFVAELEMVGYGERPPLLAEVRQGLGTAASLASDRPELKRWFEDRRDALPGDDLPEETGYIPV